MDHGACASDVARPQDVLHIHMEERIMPKKEDDRKGQPEVTWQDQLAQAGEQTPQDKAWKKVRKSDAKDLKTAMERQRAARLARDAK
jgi:hypothetical protein